MNYEDFKNLSKPEQENLYTNCIKNAANIITPYERDRDINYPQSCWDCLNEHQIDIKKVDNAIFQGMYAHCYFPHHSNRWTELSVDDNNIYSGQAHGGLNPNFEMIWEGYASVIYDGTFHLALVPEFSEKAYILGHNECGDFYISGYKLIQGIPPAGLRVHCERTIMAKSVTA